MKYPRFIIRRLKEALKDTPVVLLNGPRQAGKSTLVKHVGNERGDTRYVTLDDFTVLAAAKKDPEGFIRGFNGSLIIDEVQRAPELFLAIKRAVDEVRHPGRFLLTGSANVLLLPHLADSLAGRIEILPLYPLSINEVSGEHENLIDRLFDSDELNISSFRTLPMRYASVTDMLVVGGYPEMVERFSPARRRAWIQAYITTILLRDVRDLSAIEGLSQIPDLLSVLATRSGTLLNYSELSRATGLTMSTLKRYFHLLEMLFMVHTIPAWSRNRSKRLVKSPKVHITDTGILCHLLGLDVAGLECDKIQSGKILETFVVNECLKAASWSNLLVRLHHYRTLTGSEVDCVLETADGRVVGIEVKAAARVGTSDIRGLQTLRDDVGDKFVKGLILYQGKTVVPFGDRITALPIVLQKT